MWGGVHVEERIHGTLGDVSLVRIAELLMREAVAHSGKTGVRFSYYCLVSGQDYPLIPVPRMLHELCAAYPRPFIDCTPWDAGNWVGAGSANCPWYGRCMNGIDRRMQRSPLRRLVKLPVMAANGIARRFSSAKSEADKRGVLLYGGSAWWVLPDVMVDHVLEVMGNQELREGYLPVEMVAAPEENYFQTVLMDSRFKDAIQVNPKDMVAQNCKTFANFSPAGRPFTGHPYIFTREDTGELERLAQDHYFARKFDETVDASVLDWIDANLLAEE